MDIFQRRFGHPRTEAERRARHKRLHGTTKLPPRGTGKKRYLDMLKRSLKNKV